MADLDRAVAALCAGKVVLYPTDTLWGLAVLPGAPGALAALFAVKRRPEGAPVSLAFSSAEEIEPYVALTPERRGLLRRLLPGPYTLLVPASPWAHRTLPRELLGPGGTLGVRVPDHPVARELARRAGPLTSTSANRHGEPPSSGVARARRTFGGEVSVYLAGAPAPSGRASTLVTLTGTQVTVRARA